MIRQSIVGGAHSQFGKFPDRDIEDLLATVAVVAIADAGIEPLEIDAVSVGAFNSGFSKQDFAASLAMQSVPELRFKPAIRCENACTSGNAALVVGVEKMSGSHQRRSRQPSPQGPLPARGGGHPGRVSGRVRPHCDRANIFLAL